MKIRKFETFKINESNYKVDYDGDTEDGYMKNWANAFDKYILPLKEIKGSGSEYEVDIQIILQNGKIS